MKKVLKAVRFLRAYKGFNAGEVAGVTLAELNDVIKVRKLAVLHVPEGETAVEPKVEAAAEPKVEAAVEAKAEPKAETKAEPKNRSSPRRSRPR